MIIFTHHFLEHFSIDNLFAEQFGINLNSVKSIASVFFSRGWRGGGGGGDSCIHYIGRGIKNEPSGGLGTESVVFSM